MLSSLKMRIDWTLQYRRHTRFSLFADRIDTAVKGDKKVKKVIAVFGIGVFLICAFAIAVSILEAVPIG